MYVFIIYNLVTLERN